MKKFSLKFMVVFILVLFNSLIYADGVFLRYYLIQGINFLNSCPTFSI